VLLGIDVGTSRTKAVLVDEQGREVASAAVATPFASRDGRVEMEVEGLFGGMRDVLAALGDKRGRVVAVGLAGMAESGAPLGSGGKALAPVIAWHATVARRQCRGSSVISDPTWRCVSASASARSSPSPRWDG